MPDEANPGPLLSPKERAALTLLATGLSTGDIAEQLHITENTVSSILRGVRNKTGTRGRPTLLDFVYRNGQLPAPLRREPEAGRSLDEAKQHLLLQLAAGWSAKDIAAGLGLSVEAVKSRIKTLRALLGCDTAVQAVRAGWELGYLTRDVPRPMPGEARPPAVIACPEVTFGSLPASPRTAPVSGRRTGAPPQARAAQD